MRVAVRVDAGPLIGGGHATRCLALADALAERGAEVTFVSAAMPDAIASRIAASGHKLVCFPAPADMNRTGHDWHEPPFNSSAQAADVEATRAAAGKVDWLIVDHYLLDARWHSAARGFAKGLLVIDDLANRPYDCDLLVDETGGRSPADYDSLVPEAANILAGANYALLRPEFARERPVALERRREPSRAARILISFGTTDPGAISAAAVDQVLKAAPNCAIEVVVSEKAESLPQLQEMASRRSDITIHVNSNRMAELMRDADLAIGAAGTTSWERCCLGLPAVALVLAENQRRNADALERSGAAVKLERADQIGPAVASLITDPECLHRMSAAAFRLTDGLGASRVAEAMVEARANASPVRA